MMLVVSDTCHEANSTPAMPEIRPARTKLQVRTAPRRMPARSAAWALPPMAYT